jgi:ribokinase
MVGRVGGDAFGGRLIENLKAYDVDTRRVRVDQDAATGTAVIVVSAQGENNIVISPGANGRVAPADVDAAAPQLGTAKILLLQFEIPPETVLCAATLAKQNGLQVILNPAPARAVTPELFALVDILVPNETELQLLSGQPVTDTASIERAAHALLAQGVKTVIVTLGEQGALLVSPEQVVHVPGQQVEVVDTTAAGDSFIGGLAAALVRGRSLEEAVRYANCAGALAVTKFGAQPSLPSAAEVEAFYTQTR